MNKRTHTVIGAAAALLVCPSSPLIAAALGGMVASTPDYIERPLGLDHRKASHSVFAVAAVWWLAAWVGHPLGLAVVASYAAHILADMLTIAGVYVLAPVNRKRRAHLLPKWFRLRTGGIFDSLIGATVGVWLLYALSPHLSVLIDSRWIPIDLSNL